MGKSMDGNEMGQRKKGVSASMKQWSLSAVLACDVGELKKLKGQLLGWVGWEAQISALLVGGFGMSLSLTNDWMNLLSARADWEDQIFKVGLDAGILSVLILAIVGFWVKEAWTAYKKMRQHWSFFKAGGGFKGMPVLEQIQANFSPLSPEVMSQYDGLWYELMETEEGKRWQEFYQHYGFYPALMEVWLKQQGQDSRGQLSFEVLAKGLMEEMVLTEKQISVTGVESDNIPIKAKVL